MNTELREIKVKRKICCIYLKIFWRLQILHDSYVTFTVLRHLILFARSGDLPGFWSFLEYIFLCFCDVRALKIEFFSNFHTKQIEFLCNFFPWLHFMAPVIFMTITHVLEIEYISVEQNICLPKTVLVIWFQVY